MALKNARHERFVQNLISGMTQRQAYLDAFPNAENWKPETIDSKASNLFADDKVQTRYQQLQNASASLAVAGRTERMELLTQFARDESMFPKTRMQAIDILNKMDGEYVKKIEATVSGDISEIASKVGAILDE